MPAALRKILGVTFRWAGAWAILGLLAGVLLMFGKVELIAEPGAKSSHISDYAFWIPLVFGTASVFGLALGFVFAGLMALASHSLAATEIRRSCVALHSIRLICGALAGGLLGWPITRDENALVFAAFGLGCAAISCMANRGQRLGTAPSS